MPWSQPAVRVFLRGVGSLLANFYDPSLRRPCVRRKEFQRNPTQITSRENHICICEGTSRGKSRKTELYTLQCKEAKPFESPIRYFTHANTDSDNMNI